MCCGRDSLFFVLVVCYLILIFTVAVTSLEAVTVIVTVIIHFICGEIVT
jgi:hypothetical protein